jgi:hypothetical protein
LNSAVVRKRTPMPSRRICDARSAGESIVSLVTPTRRPPLSSAPQISKVAASKEVFEAWARMSSGPRAM